MENSQFEESVFAGGCFWCTEAVFQRIKGVLEVESGYAGGEGDSPTYEKVSSGEGNFAEAIRIKFDPKIISFEKLLDIFWATHDPTTLNQQGADIGTQYRSSIFYTNLDQKQKAENSKVNLEKSGRLNKNIVTKIEPLLKFYKAEEYHQNYYNSYKDTNPYCSIIIDPKVKKLIEQFNEDIKEEYKFLKVR